MAKVVLTPEADRQMQKLPRVILQTLQTISIANDELVVLSRKDFNRLMEKAGMLPARPRRDAHGNVPARAAIDVSIARDLVTDRIRRGWTQTELARRSGVRLETISRIESGKHVPRQETLLKLERALSAKRQQNML
jgi:ribosome-binding protein aMBF1 (putative translation factor)